MTDPINPEVILAGAPSVSIPPAGRGRAPLSAVLAFTFLGSLGTGIVTTGLFFIAKNVYGFSNAQNFLLGLLEGIAYIGGALGAGPAIRRLRRAFPSLTTRHVLVAISVLLGLLCLIPILMGKPADPESASQWPVWVLMLTYAPLTGALWPIVESYLSGGRTGPTLRSALGRFNITWSSAVVLGLVIVGPTKGHAAEMIAFLALVHFGSLVLVWKMGREPGRHLEEHHEPHPIVYDQLLATFRILLPTTYVVLMALAPYLPGLLGSVGIEPGYQAPLAATWTAARVATFLLLERWHGWHGRWYPATAGMLLLLGGFAAAVLSPTLGAGTLAQTMAVAGLLALGVGMATIYSGALYYALVVGQAEVEAGGTHEALIGVGYTVGPLCGLLAIGASDANLIPATDSAFEIAVLTLVGAIAIAAASYAGWRSVRILRTARNAAD